MLARYGYLANKWLVLGMVLTAVLGAALLVTLLPLGAQNAPIEYAENGTDPVANFTAVDPEGRQVTWNALAGDDAPDFSIEDGVLTFNSPPNFEAPTDRAGTGTAGDNIYELTLMATDGTVATSETIQVQVTNVDEPATTTIEVSLVQPREGETVTIIYADNEGNPFVNAAGTANSAIMDPDGDKDKTTSDADFTTIEGDVTYQWSRGASPVGTFRDITEEENPTRDQAVYDVIDADRNHYLRVVATYEDTEGEGKELMATSLRPTIRLRADVKAPVFPEDFDLSTPLTADALSVEIDDGAEAGSNVGGPVTATGETGEGEVLTYSLVADTGGTATHADLFQINRITGQVTVGIGKTVNPASDGNDNVADPKGDSFTVAIQANDGAPAHDDPENPGTDVPHVVTVVMTITVDPTDENPVFTRGQTEHEFAEIPAGTTPTDEERNVYVFEAYDPEDATVTFALSGVDMADFTLETATAVGTDVTTQALRFAAAPDFENPADANEDNVYMVTLTATSGTDPDEKETAIDITVTVTNEDDPGSLSMSARQPRIGVPISAVSLSDLDGAVSGVSYQWSRDTTGSAASPTADAACATNTTWEDAQGEGADTATYTPQLADDGKCLRARATYTDPQGDGNAEVASTEAVEKARNLAPMFPDDVEPRFVPENVAANAGVVAEAETPRYDITADPPTTSPNTTDDPVTATDTLDADTSDDASISYTLSGADAMYFTIDTVGGTQPGQIRVSTAGAAALDYETRRTYMVTVTAADLEGLNTSTVVTINIVDVNEGPEIMEGRLAVSGEPLIPYDSMGTDDVATYTAVGVDASGAAWSLSGDDAGAFSISTGGVLTFNTPPDYANPADANSDNVYMVTVVATSGGEMAEKMVAVTVGSAVAPGERTDISQYTNQERFDLDGNGIVDDGEVREVLRQYFADN